MIKTFFYKLKGLFNLSEKENIKEVLEDLIEEDVNGLNNIDAGTRNIFKNVINLSDKCIEELPHICANGFNGGVELCSSLF